MLACHASHWRHQHADAAADDDDDDEDVDGADDDGDRQLINREGILVITSRNTHVN